MATFNNIDRERIAIGERSGQNKTNTLGLDGYAYAEPFTNNSNILITSVWNDTPTSDSNFVVPGYDDFPSEGAIGTRHVQLRLHSYLPSAVKDFKSAQTFVIISAAPASNSISDIEAVRIKNIIPPNFSQGRSNAAESTSSVRGFGLALYPAITTAGVGTALAADTANGPIPITADPGAGTPIEVEEGAGDTGFWYMDYENGIVRFSSPPLHGSGGLMNPNDIYGDIDGLETASDGYGSITLFGTFYKYTGRFGTNENTSFVTLGDGVKSTGIFEGTTQNTAQAAVDILDGYGGGTLFIKEGDYTYDGAVTIPSNISIIGMGGANITKTTSDPSFVIEGDNVAIKGLDIINNSLTGSCIEIRGTSVTDLVENIIIEDNVLYAHKDAYGVGFAPKFPEVIFRNIHIGNNTFKTSKLMVAEGLDSGTRYLYHSPDGITWTKGNVSPRKIFASASDGDGVWVIQGASNNNTYISYDNLDSVNVVAGTGTGFSTAVDYDTDSSHWVLGNFAGDLYMSTDGLSWSILGTTAGVINDIKYYKGVWMAASDSGIIVISRDHGATWADSDSGVSSNLNTIYYSDDPSAPTGVRWVAAGSNGAIVTSINNGNSWDDLSIGGTADFVSIASDVKNNRWVATINDVNDGSAYISDDGVSWSQIPMPYDKVGKVTFEALEGDMWFTSIAKSGTSLFVAFYSRDRKHWFESVGTVDGISSIRARDEDAVYIRNTDINDGYVGLLQNVTVENNTFGIGGLASIILDGTGVRSINDVVFSDNKSIGLMDITVDIPGTNVKYSNNIKIINNSNIGTLTTDGIDMLVVENSSMQDVSFSNTARVANVSFSNNVVDGYFECDGYVSDSTIYGNTFNETVTFNSGVDGYLVSTTIESNRFNGLRGLRIPLNTNRLNISSNYIRNLLDDGSSGEGMFEYYIGVQSGSPLREFVSLDEKGEHRYLKISNNTIDGLTFLGPVIGGSINDNNMSSIHVRSDFTPITFSGSFSDNTFSATKLAAPAGAMVVFVVISNAYDHNDAKSFVGTLSGNVQSKNEIGVDHWVILHVLSTGKGSAVSGATISDNLVNLISILSQSSSISTAAVVTSSISGNISPGGITIDNDLPGQCLVNSILSDNVCTSGGIVIGESTTAAITNDRILYNAIISNNATQAIRIAGPDSIIDSTSSDLREWNALTYQSSLITNNNITLGKLQMRGKSNKCNISDNICSVAEVGNLNSSKFSGNVVDSNVIISPSTTTINRAIVSNNVVDGYLQIGNEAVLGGSITSSIISDNVSQNSIRVYSDPSNCNISNNFSDTNPMVLGSIGTTNTIFGNIYNTLDIGTEKASSRRAHFIDGYLVTGGNPVISQVWSGVDANVSVNSDTSDNIFATGLNIEANSLVVGSTIEIFMSGKISLNGDAGTFTVSLRIGNVVVQSIVSPGAITLSDVFSMHLFGTVTLVGDPGVLNVLIYYPQEIVASNSVLWSSTKTISIPTTSNIAISISGQWQNSGGGNGAVLEQFIVRMPYSPVSS